MATVAPPRNITTRVASADSLPTLRMTLQEHVSLVIAVRDQNNVPLQASAVTEIRVVARRGQGEKVINAVGTADNALAGTWVFEVLSASTRYAQPGRYSYDVWATLTSGEKVPLGKPGSLFIEYSPGGVL